MIFNGTPHQINMYREDSCTYDQASRKLIVKQGSSPVLSLEKGIPLNAKMENNLIGELEGCQIKDITFVSVDDPKIVFPQSSSEDWFVVSNLYATAAKAVEMNYKLLTVGGTVYESADNPRPVGCLYFIRA